MPWYAWVCCYFLVGSVVAVGLEVEMRLEVAKKGGRCARRWQDAHLSLTLWPLLVIYPINYLVGLVRKHTPNPIAMIDRAIDAWVERKAAPTRIRAELTREG